MHTHSQDMTSLNCDDAEHGAGVEADWCVCVHMCRLGYGGGQTGVCVCVCVCVCADWCGVVDCCGGGGQTGVYLWGADWCVCVAHPQPGHDIMEL